MTLFETTALAPDSARVSLAPQLFWQLHMLFVYVFRALGERTEPASESQAEAMASKRAEVNCDGKPRWNKHTIWTLNMIRNKPYWISGWSCLHYNHL